MFTLRLRNAGHVRQFLILRAGPFGWEVRQELDDQVLRSARLLDWHKVERARRAFEREVLALRERGWVEG